MANRKAVREAVRKGHVKAGVKPLRALWASNAPWGATGYAVQTAQIVERMQADGHEVAIAANFGLQGCDTEWNGTKIYPAGIAPYSDDILWAHAQHWFSASTLPNMVFTLFDVWALKNPSIDQIPRIAAYVPIDHQPGPPEVIQWLRKPNVMPIAMSQFGSRMLELEKIEHLYAPHAFDGKVFKPTEHFPDAQGKQVTGRDLMEIPDPDRFVVMINSANKGRTPPRKCWGENLLAFSVFAQDKPDAILYLHTDESAALQGVDLPALIRSCGLRDDQVKIVNQYLYRMNLPQVALAALYTAADVLLCASAGEGFGVPVIEAQACGTPVIVSNFTAQPELVGDGWCVDGQPMWDPNQNSWFFTPFVAQIVRALEHAYERKGSGKSSEAITFAEQYEADRVYAEHWRPTLDRLALWQP